MDWENLEYELLQQGERRGLEIGERRGLKKGIQKGFEMLIRSGTDKNCAYELLYEQYPEIKKETIQEIVIQQQNTSNT